MGKESIQVDTEQRKLTFRTFIKQCFCKHEFKIEYRIEHVKDACIENYFIPFKVIKCSKCGKEHLLHK